MMSREKSPHRFFFARSDEMSSHFCSHNDPRSVKQRPMLRENTSWTPHWDNNDISRHCGQKETMRRFFTAHHSEFCKWQMATFVSDIIDERFAKSLICDQRAISSFVRKQHTKTAFIKLEISMHGEASIHKGNKSQKPKSFCLFRLDG